jgi:hypothetical protein
MKLPRNVNGPQFIKALKKLGHERIRQTVPTSGSALNKAVNTMRRYRITPRFEWESSVAFSKTSQPITS